MAGDLSLPGWDGVSEFYEDDEPVADVIAAFEAGEPVTTDPPADREQAAVELTQLREEMGFE